MRTNPCVNRSCISPHFPLLCMMSNICNMKTVRRILFIILCVYSCSTFAQEFTQYFYPDGTVSSQGMMVDGKPDGYWKTFYKSGVLKSVGKRTNFMLDSVWCFYNEQGKREKEISYFEDHKNGYYKEYTTTDSLTYLSSVVMYVNDLRQGMEQHFAPNGALLSEVPFLDNKREGEAYEYADSTIVTITIYENDRIISSQAINRTDQDGRLNGLQIAFFPNGEMKTEANYVHGQLNGLYKLYSQHGQLLQVGNYEHDSLIYSSSTMVDFEDPQEKKIYYADSSLQYKGAYRNNTPIGVHRHYNQQGAVISGELYDTLGTLVGSGITLESGEKIGEWQFFSPSGKKESEGMFADGKKTGLWKFYYPDETLKQTGYYAEGLYHGLWTFYNYAGDVQKEEEYVHGEREGLSIEYDDEGVKILEGMYKSDTRQGFWVVRQGDLITQGEYTYGEKIGVWKSSFLNGNKAFRGEFFADKPNGRHVYFYKNGRVEHDEQWRNGKAVKSWNYYQENGQLKYTVYYKNGEESRIVVPTK